MNTARPRETIRKLARGKNGFGFFCSVLVCLKRGGASAAADLIRKRREEKDFERRTRASLSLDPREREAQAKDCGEDAPVFSIAVPVYNTPEAFLREMIRSVKAQSWPGWELLLADGSDAEHAGVRAVCEEEAAGYSRIRYRKLESNGGISENSNAALEMASGDYIVLLDHDDLLVPSALWEAARVIRETGADFLYSDEAVFASPDPRKITEIHRKAEYSQDELLRSNYICHLTAFRRDLLREAGGFRKEYDGSQDHDLFLRLTDAADRVAHIPKALYFWRSHEGSVAGSIGAKQYAVDAGIRAVRDFLLDRKGVRAEVKSSEECATIYEIRMMKEDETGR